MKTAIMAFSDRGEALANRIAESLPEAEVSRSGRPLTAKEWTERFFDDVDALIFVGATGIAVRAIAPHIKSKAEDPAVIVVDERGLHAISLLSGHLGGANELTERIARSVGADPVITTATDVNGVFAVDDWARKQGLCLTEKEKIIEVSGKLLAGESVTFRSRWPVAGEIPEGLVATEQEDADIIVDIVDKGERGLHLIPRICALGIGCRRGTRKEEIQGVLEDILQRTGLSKEAIKKVASIDLKKDEEGLLELCRDNEWDFVTYTAEELMAVPGEFSSSDFVRKTTGSDNVCERSAVRVTGGRLILKKYSKDGITLAIAKEEYRPGW